MSEGVPDRVRDFLLAYVDSIEQLEVLLLLASRPASPLTAAEIADELRTAPSSAANRLAKLRDHRLVEVLPGDRHRVRADPELAETLRQVAACYRERRVTVVTLIYSRPSDVVRVFTNAFVLKKGPKDG
jgi:DNA-binding MarR family transcriptional regulator